MANRDVAAMSRPRAPRRGLVGAGGVLLAMLALAACARGGSGPEEYVLAFKVTEDRRVFVEETRPLAEWISAHTGVATRVLTVHDDRAQITALATGQADAAYMSGGPAWLGWSEFGLNAIAAEVDEDGRTSYTAGLWVRADDGIEGIADVRGLRSCHTGELAGTGMLVPIGYLIAHGYVDTAGLDLEDISAVPRARARFFGDARIGGGYLGAFRCLSTGEGDVATGRSTAWEDFCAEEPESWCGPREAYRWLPRPGGPDPAVPGTGGLAQVPSHPVMVSPALAAEPREALRKALLALNDSPEGRAIMRDVLGAAGLTPTDAATHLGPYGELLQHVPGIRAHLGGGA